MSISAERSRSVRFLAGRTDRSLRVGREVFHDAKRSPISRPYNKRFIYELAIFVGTRSVQRHTYVGGRPWWTSMQVPHSAHVFRFEILFTCYAHGQSAIRKLHVQSLIKAWRREGQNILINGEMKQARVSSRRFNRLQWFQHNRIIDNLPRKNCLAET